MGYCGRDPREKGRGSLTSGIFCSPDCSWTSFCVSSDKHLQEHSFRTQSGEKICRVLSSVEPESEYGFCLAFLLSSMIYGICQTVLFKLSVLRKFWEGAILLIFSMCFLDPNTVLERTSDCLVSVGILEQDVLGCLDAQQ